MDHEDDDGYGDGLDSGVDGDSGGGMEKTFGGDSGGVSPLRSSPTATFYLSVSSFVFLPASLWKTSGDILYRRF